MATGPEPALEAWGGAPGLTSAEAAARLARAGPNEPAPAGGRALPVELLLLLVNPLSLVLLAAAALSFFLHERADAAVIAAMVVLGVVLDFVQTFRARRAADALRAAIAPTATVRRDGAWKEVLRREVVPGDVVRLGAGDLVPADARLLEARDLHVQQAALSGESLPVEKEARPGAAAEGGPEDPHLVFLGTSVVSGIAVAEVLATGRRTAFGEIAVRLALRPPETAFERGLRQFGLLVVRAVVALVAFLLVVSLALHRNAWESLLFAVALAVGLTPEFLPMITTVTLSRGALRMARARVVVKHLASIQNLGGMDVLCCDKTGTLTVGEMRLDRSIDPSGAPSDAPLVAARLNSAFESGIRSPLDAAILAGGGAPAGWAKRDEIPFDFERRRLSVVVERDGERWMVTKGAPEGVLAACGALETARGPVPADAEARERCRRVHQELESGGFRVLAVARRRLDAPGPWSAADERDLALTGFLAFADPPRPDTAPTIAALREDGVAVKVITGDNELVAARVAADVGLGAGEVVLGEDVGRMGDAALQHVAESASVFARVTPAQKSRIILALKHRGHVVGYLGDGINDAPSLHVADVGISVSTAVDVARDAADVILLERGLPVIHTGVLEGRQAFGNVMKYLLMETSSNFGNMFSMAGAAIFLPFLPMLPGQILLNNFLYDLAQVTIPGDAVDPGYLRRPQRWDVRLIRRFMLIIGPVSSIYDFLTFFVLLRFFHASEPLFHTGWFVESVATQTLVVLVIRTAGNPLRSRPSTALAVTVALVVAAAVALPYTPLAPVLGLVPMPASFLAFVLATVVTYLLVVEWTKRRVMRAALA